MKNEKFVQTKEELIKIFWVFLIGSIIGCIVETLVGIIFDHSFKIRQGLIYGPFIPVYGIGAIMYYFIVSRIKDTKKIFILSMFLGGAIEYFCSYFQELCFGTVSWDYSNMFLNIGGRTSLLFCFCWGILGVLFVKFLFPLLQKIDIYIGNMQFKYITAILVSFMIFNIGISCLAGARQNQRVQKIEADSKMDAFLDKHYPDVVMDNVYSNKMNRIKVPKIENI